MSAANNIPAGYKRTEVGIIPDDWEVVTFGQLFEFLQTANNSRSDLSDCEEIYYIHYGDIHTKWNNFVDFEKHLIPMISSCNLVGGELLCDGDLIVADASEDTEGVGKSVEVVNLGYNIAVAGLHTFLLRSKSSHIANGFKGYLQSFPSVRAAINRVATGLKVYGITKNNLRNISFPLPPLAEQAAIAEVLSDTDDWIAAQEVLIAKKRALKTATMQQLLTGRTRLPGFSGEWEEKTFDELFDFLPTANNSRADLEAEGDIKYIHYGDIHTKWDNHLDFSKSEIPSISESKIKSVEFLKDGDLIVADASEDYEGVGKSIEIINLGDVKAVAGLHTFLLRSKNDDLINGFKGFIQEMPTVKQSLNKLATGLKVYGISKVNIKKVSFFVPSLSEQAAIAEVLSDMDAELEALEAQLAKSRALKQGLMQELLTGRTRLLAETSPLKREANP